MNVFKPESEELMAHYRERARAYSQIADALSIPRFPPDFMNELSVRLGGSENSRLFEAVSRIGNYNNAADHADLRKSVGKLLKKQGVRLPPGKRTRPELQKLVENLTPVLLYMGIPSASSERSHLVVILQRVAEAFNVSGDPRDTLRTWIRNDLKQEKKSKELAWKTVRDAIRAGFSDD